MNFSISIVMKFNKIAWRREWVSQWQSELYRSFAPNDMKIYKENISCNSCSFLLKVHSIKRLMQMIFLIICFTLWEHQKFFKKKKQYWKWELWISNLKNCLLFHPNYVLQKPPKIFLIFKNCQVEHCKSYNFCLSDFSKLSH